MVSSCIFFGICMYPSSSLLNASLLIRWLDLLDHALFALKVTYAHIHLLFCSPGALAKLFAINQSAESAVLCSPYGLMPESIIVIAYAPFVNWNPLFVWDQVPAGFFSVEFVPWKNWLLCSTLWKSDPKIHCIINKKTKRKTNRFETQYFFVCFGSVRFQLVFSFSCFEETFISIRVRQVLVSRLLCSGRIGSVETTLHKPWC